MTASISNLRLTSTKQRLLLRNPAANLARKAKRVKRKAKARRRVGNLPKNGNHRRRGKVVERSRGE
eukprot:357402-Karenia_brevis.AAC.1